MKANDSVNELFRARFQEHVSPVDAGLWESIAAQIPVVPVAGADEGLRDLFQDRFSGHEMAVDPSAWQAINSQLGGVAGAGSAGVGLGWVAAGIGAVALVAGSLFVLSETESTPKVATLPEVAQVEEPVNDTEKIIQEEPIPVVPNSVAENAVTGSAKQETTISIPVEVIEEPISKTEAPVANDAAGPAEVVAEEVIKTSEQDLVPSGPTEKGKQVVAAVLQQLEEEAALNEQLRSDTDRAEPIVEEDQAPTQEEVEEAAPFIESESIVPIVLHIPNVFTPNNDGINDKFVVQGSGFEKVTVRIFSAADSRLVFQATDLGPWSGTDLRGTPSPEGQYFYAIEAVDHAGRVHARGETIQLMR